MPVLVVTMTWKRLSSYYLSSLLYPTILISTLTFFTLFLPAGSLEKSGVAAVLVLGVYVLQQVVVELAPSTENLPYCVIAVEICLALAGLVFLSAVLFIVMQEATFTMAPRLQFMVNKIYCTVYLQPDDSHELQHLEQHGNLTRNIALVPLITEEAAEVTKANAPGGQEQSDPVLSCLKDIRYLLLENRRIHMETVEEKTRRRWKLDCAALNTRSWRRLASLINLLFVVAYASSFLLVAILYLFPLPVNV